MFPPVTPLLRRAAPRSKVALLVAGCLAAGSLVVPPPASASLGLFPTYASSDNPGIVEVLAALDFTADGRTDLVLRDYGAGLQGGGVRLFLRPGLPTGEFGQPMQISVGTSSAFVNNNGNYALVGDFNGDHVEDLLVESAPAGCLDFCEQPTDAAVLLGGRSTTSGTVLFQSTRMYNTSTFGGNPSAFSLVPGDVNGDGRSDIVQSGNSAAVPGGSPSLRVHITQSDGTLATATLSRSDLDSYSIAQFVADADGGGVANDIVAKEVRPDGSAQILVYFNGSPSPTALTPMSRGRIAVSSGCGWQDNTRR